MDIKETSMDGVVVIALLGRLDELAAPEAQQTFADLVVRQAERVVLDMTGVEYISSSGLRVLLMLFRALGKHGGQLKLCGLTPFVAEVFEVSNFTTIFDIHATQDAAVRAFAPRG